MSDLVHPIPSGRRASPQPPGQPVAQPPVQPAPSASGTGGARPRLTRARWDVIAVVAVGGSLGSLLRYETAVLLPTPAGAFPWSTALVNVVGCFAIGMLMVLITEAAVTHRLLRPFLGVGVLGGLTTFSTYVVDALHLVLAARPGLAATYLAGSLLAALTAVALGTLAMRVLLRLTGRIGFPGTHAGR